MKDFLRSSHSISKTGLIRFQLDVEIFIAGNGSERGGYL